MARGGRREGAGRKRGQVSEATKLRVEIARQALEQGLTPLDLFLSIMRDEAQSIEARFAAAKESAPYIHARLAAVEHSGKLNVTTHEQALSDLEQAAGIASAQSASEIERDGDTIN